MNDKSPRLRSLAAEFGEREAPKSDPPDQERKPHQGIPPSDAHNTALAEQAGEAERRRDQEISGRQPSAKAGADHASVEAKRDEPQETSHEGARIHSRYADGTPVYEGRQPGKIRGPAPEATGPHTVLARDLVNHRTYKAREYDGDGYPVRDIDFTIPTFPSGRERPDHTAPEQHLYIPNDPENPRAGFKRGPGRPL